MGNYTEVNACDLTITAVESALENLKILKQKTPKMQFTFGFDGYIDSLYRMVRSRKNLEEVEYYDSMEEFGQHIVNIAGSSGSIERILKKHIGGGFAPNTARAVANMAPQSKVHLFGAMGYPNMDPLFKELPQNVQLYSIGNPGKTLALEFTDGKIMSQDMGGIFELSWEVLLERMGGREVLIDIFERSNAIGQGHWSLMLHMNDYWRHFITDIFPSMSGLKQKRFFVDPADLNKRSIGDIRDMLFLLREMNEQIPVMLSLNDREAIDVGKSLLSEGVPIIEKDNFESYELAGQEINKVLNLDYLVIHEPHFATISGNTDGKQFHHWITEGYTSKPKFTTAAGDHFNGAVLMSLAAGLDSKEALVIGNAATAIFVRTGRSPTVDALQQYIDNYFNYIEEDIDSFCFPDEE